MTPTEQIADTAAASACSFCHKPTAEEGGIHPACIDKKHVKLRGSMQLLYTLGTPELTCQQRCKCGRNHPCYLRLNHNIVIDHRYTSECLQG